MEQDGHELEEGELQEDDYTPLQRPSTYSLDIPQKRFEVTNHQYSEDEDDEDESPSSDTDSDSDADVARKRKKVRPNPKLQRSTRPREKKYDVWSTRVQEDVLAETMISCDVSLKDRSRAVESYDPAIVLRQFCYEGEESVGGHQGTKRTRCDRRNVDFKPKSSETTGGEYQGTPRHIPELRVIEADSPEEIAKDMAEKLSETKDDLILKTIHVMGKKRAFEIFEETRAIEKDGGMPIMNQTRRRTAGGVFLYLVRHDYYITPEQRQQIFAEDKLLYNKKIKQKQKAKREALKKAINADKNSILPELLTRTEKLANENPIRILKKTEETCTNPPPSPETDHHESGDNMETPSQMDTQPLPSSQARTDNDQSDVRGKLRTYDDDFLDINCDADMDLF